MKKYELTDETMTVAGRELHRIRALRDFGNVKAGDLGGYIESEKNLSHEGTAWVSGNAMVSGNATVSGNAEVSGFARVYDFARVSGNAEVSGKAMVSGNANVTSNEDYIIVRGLGSMNRTTTFYTTSSGGVEVNCGCFHGTLEEFVQAVQKTHEESKYAKEYLAAVEMIKIHFEL